MQCWAPAEKETWQHERKEQRVLEGLLRGLPLPLPHQAVNWQDSQVSQLTEPQVLSLTAIHIVVLGVISLWSSSVEGAGRDVPWSLSQSFLPACVSTARDLSHQLTLSLCARSRIEKDSTLAHNAIDFLKKKHFVGSFPYHSETLGGFPCVLLF